MSPTTALHIRHTLYAEAAIKDTDLVVVASSHRAFLNWGFDWPDRRALVNSGPDGADHALLAVLGEDVPARFDSVVLASGDAIFTDTIAHLGSQGVHVTVAAPASCMARLLRMAAAATIYLPETLIRQDAA